MCRCVVWWSDDVDGKCVYLQVPVVWTDAYTLRGVLEECTGRNSDSPVGCKAAYGIAISNCRQGFVLRLKRIRGGGGSEVMVEEEDRKSVV